MLEIKPLFARVLIEREVEEITKGGIIIPDDAKKRHAPTRGKIIAIGDNVDPSLKVGQTVVFGMYSGAWLDPKHTKAENDLFICQDEDILAVIGEA